MGSFLFEIGVYLGVFFFDEWLAYPITLGPLKIVYQRKLWNYFQSDRDASHEYIQYFKVNFNRLSVRCEIPYTYDQ